MTKVVEQGMTHQWSVIHENKSYRVKHHVAAHDNYNPEQGVWTVIGGGNYRDHHCDENGQTFKKIVGLVKAHLRNKAQDRAVEEILKEKGEVKWA